MSYKLDRVASNGLYNLKSQFDSVKRERGVLAAGRFILDEDFVDAMTKAQNYEDHLQGEMYRFIRAMGSLGFEEGYTLSTADQIGFSRKRAREAALGINTTWKGNADWVRDMTFKVEKGGEDDPLRRVELLTNTYLSKEPMVDVTKQ
jgi:hypothetical protein